MDSWIYGAGVFALAIIAAFLLFSEFRAAERAEEPEAFRWGDKQRHYRQEEVAWWADHSFLFVVACMGAWVALSIMG